MSTRKTFIQLQFGEQSSADLRGRQSVRTTFKLPEKSINALSLLAGQMGIKQKSLFDHLIEDIRALKIIARDLEEYNRSERCVAKTYVISRKTLENLEQISTEFNTPRDALVEFSIERILPLLQREKERHLQRKRLLKELEDYFVQGLDLLKKGKEQIGEEDPAFVQMVNMMKAVGAGCDNIGELVDKGRKIEGF